MMTRLSTSSWAVVACFLSAATCSVAFRPLHFTAAPLRQATHIGSAPKNLNEFDFLLHENESSESSSQIQIVSRRRIQLNDNRGTVLVSSTALAAPTVEEETLDVDAEESSSAAFELDPYADVALETSPQMQRLQQSTEQQQSTTQKIEAKLKTMDLQDVVSTLIIPSIVAFAGIRWGYNKVTAKLVAKADSLLDSFATDLIYHDGDFEEMKLSASDYSKKLAWLGPGKTEKMLKRYLALYSKKKTVSPQSISSLSYVFSLFKLSEEKAANILVNACRDMGDMKISSSGKLLFFGSRILKSPEGKTALLPIKNMIKATYRDAEVAETLVETSQQAIGEAAYKSAVQAGGKNQKSLSIGWEVLGLTKETATRIFKEEAETGFELDRVTMYKGQTTKYDRKGNIISKDEAAKAAEKGDDVTGTGDDDNEDLPMPTSNVMVCGNCGYTLFIAKGREAKFFGPGFTCPECGASKDKFAPPEDDEE